MAHGSRVLGHADRNHFARELGIVFFNRLVSFITRTHVTDCSNGYRAVRTTRPAPAGPAPGAVPHLRVHDRGDQARHPRQGGPDHGRSSGCTATRRSRRCSATASASPTRSCVPGCGRRVWRGTLLGLLRGLEASGALWARHCRQLRRATRRSRERRHDCISRPPAHSRERHNSVLPDSKRRAQPSAAERRVGARPASRSPEVPVSTDRVSEGADVLRAKCRRRRRYAICPRAQSLTLARPNTWSDVPIAGQDRA